MSGFMYDVSEYVHQRRAARRLRRPPRERVISVCLYIALTVWIIGGLVTILAGVGLLSPWLWLTVVLYVPGAIWLVRFSDWYERKYRHMWRKR